MTRFQKWRMKYYVDIAWIRVVLMYCFSRKFRREINEQWGGGK
jgi:hypothetical protein